MPYADPTAFGVFPVFRRSIRIIPACVIASATARIMSIADVMNAMA